MSKEELAMYNHTEKVDGKVQVHECIGYFDPPLKEWLEKESEHLVCESRYEGTDEDYFDNYDEEVILHVTHRKKNAMKDIPEDTVVYDQYKADFKNHKLTWKGYTLDSDSFIDGANYMIKGKSNVIPPSGDMSLYNFSMYTYDSSEED